MRPVVSSVKKEERREIGRKVVKREKSECVLETAYMSKFVYKTI